MNKQKTLSGPVMCQRLQQAGIPAQRVIQRMNSGQYIAEFYHPGMEQPVESSFSFAQRIQQQLLDLRVISCNDRIADWRDGQPVIWASVTFQLNSQEKRKRGA